MEQARRTRLRDTAADQLLEMVISGGLEPGERLPPERELCAHLGVSRTVVREALNLLEARGLISIQHGRGAVVSGGNPPATRGRPAPPWPPCAPAAPRKKKSAATSLPISLLISLQISLPILMTGTL